MMNLELAEKIISKAQEKAEEMGIPMCIAVVDEGGNLVAMKRMDGAMLLGIALSQNKAYTSAATRFATDDLGGISQPGQLAYGLALADQGRTIIFAGGLPLKTKDRVIGAIGVSGGLAPDDKKVAEAGASVLQ
ncbi:MAG: heme-binding protein [bacterium]|nr:heme-binding protein [bacterium]